jgi:hypothetical protein
MKRLFIAASFIALAGLLPAGCAGPGGGSPAPYTAGSPYDFSANPYCGVYGNCAQPYPRQFRPSDFQSSGF